MCDPRYVSRLIEHGCCGNSSGTPAPGAPADTQEAARRDGAETPEVSPSTTLALLQAEMDSVVKSMSDLGQGQG